MNCWFSPFPVARIRGLFHFWPLTVEMAKIFSSPPLISLVSTTCRQHSGRDLRIAPWPPPWERAHPLSVILDSRCHHRWRGLARSSFWMSGPADTTASIRCPFSSIACRTGPAQPPHTQPALCAALTCTAHDGHAPSTLTPHTVHALAACLPRSPCVSSLTTALPAGRPAPPPVLGLRLEWEEEEMPCGDRHETEDV